MVCALVACTSKHEPASRANTAGTPTAEATTDPSAGADPSIDEHGQLPAEPDQRADASSVTPETTPELEDATRCLVRTEFDACDTPGQTCSLEDGTPCACRFELAAARWNCQAQCPTAQPSGDCSDAAPGMVCVYAGESCRCERNDVDGDGQFTLDWQCDVPAPPSCAPEPQPGMPCVQPASTGFAVDPCFYPNAGLLGVECYCGRSNPDPATATWTCRDRACPLALPTGSCTYPAGIECGYPGVYREEGESIAQVCNCTAGDEDDARWSCNGQPTPACPGGPAASLQGLDCSEYTEATTCAFSAPDGIESCRCLPDVETWNCTLQPGLPPTPADDNSPQ